MGRLYLEVATFDSTFLQFTYYTRLVWIIGDTMNMCMYDKLTNELLSALGGTVVMATMLTK